MDTGAYDMYWMERALDEAKLAGERDEVPVGAALILEGQLLSSAGNAPISTHDPSGHAEILALRKAAQQLGNYRLPGTTLYVTLEPCPMCVGALLHARVTRVVFGATDSKTGALISQYRMGRDGLLNHTLKITGGVLADSCVELLQGFFAARRKKKY
ncbi:MAG: tRNA adenosine(34) deaminase TadA [Desulfopila sp.]